MSARDVIALWLGDYDGSRDVVGLKSVADTILSALDKAGYAVVPVEPTLEMIAAWDRVARPGLHAFEARYKAMLTAAKEHTMSDLVEKVARAICFERTAPACRCTKETGCQANTQSLMDHTERPAQARAAIAAVAEWLEGQRSPPPGTPLQDIINLLRAELAALRAAAGSAPNTPEVK